MGAGAEVPNNSFAAENRGAGLKELIKGVGQQGGRSFSPRGANVLIAGSAACKKMWVAKVTLSMKTMATALSGRARQHRGEFVLA